MEGDEAAVQQLLMEGDEAAVEQLRRSYDVAGSEALRRKFEEQNSADEAQIEERRALLRTFRSEGKTAAAAAGVISSMQPIYSRIKRRGKMLRALCDLHKKLAKQVKSGEKDRVAMAGTAVKSFKMPLGQTSPSDGDAPRAGSRGRAAAAAGEAVRPRRSGSHGRAVRTVPCCVRRFGWHAARSSV